MFYDFPVLHAIGKKPHIKVIQFLLLLVHEIYEPICFPGNNTIKEFMFKKDYISPKYSLCALLQFRFNYYIGMI